MKIFKLFKNFLVSRVGAVRDVASNLCLGVSVALFFSGFVEPSQSVAYYFDRWEWLGREEYFWLPVPAEDSTLWSRLFGGFVFWGLAVLFYRSKEDK